MIRNVGFVLILSIFLGCVDHQSIINEIIIVPVKPDPLKGLPDGGPLRFDNPAIGQRSHYVYFKAVEDKTTKVVSYEYNTDTLVLSITGKKDGQWIIKDFLTPGSYSIQTNKGTFKYDSVFVTLLDIGSDSIVFTRPAPGIYSTYFFTFNRNARLAFPLAPVSAPAKQNPTCSPFLSLWPDTMAYVVNYTQLGQTFDHLNIYTDYYQEETDGSVINFVYNPAYGFVRTAWFNGLIWDVGGWDLTPK